MRILVVGSNPSKSQRSRKPFHGAKCEATLRRWLERIGSHDYVLANVSNAVTPGNRALRVSEFDLDRLRKLVLDLKPHHVIALGRTAERALANMELLCIPMPHPSGLNRKLNDRDYVEKMLVSVKEWIAGETNVWREPSDFEEESETEMVLRSEFSKALSSWKQREGRTELEISLTPSSETPDHPTTDELLQTEDTLPNKS